MVTAVGRASKDSHDPVYEFYGVRTRCQGWDATQAKLDGTIVFYVCASGGGIQRQMDKPYKASQIYSFT
jgi:hypothetical protein